MITQEQYEAACRAAEEARATIEAWHRQQQEAFDQRWENDPVFEDHELVYAASLLCKCGHGMAYPEGCGPGHQWDCSAVLRGISERGDEHDGPLTFEFYAIKSEKQPSAYGATTRGVFRPKPQTQTPAEVPA